MPRVRDLGLEGDASGATQTDIVVTPGDEPAVTVEDLALAQLVYLLLDNERVSNFSTRWPRGPC